MTLFSPIIQNAFVVEDLDAALGHWTRVMGVGPFFRIDRASCKSALYRGRPYTPNYSLAIAYWGDTQIELIMPNDDDDSIYKEFIDEGHAGLLHHYCVTVDDMAPLEKRLATAPFEILADMSLEPSGRVLYLRGAAQRWPLIEVGAFAPGIYALFRMAKAAADTWDGQDPVRRL
jgi:methylmalonyl-CoA/ethylmalonyl-CoA epimerase